MKDEAVSLHRFDIKYLGCIEKANVEMKPLTIFCGNNNSGKTWLMYSLYGYFESSASFDNSQEIEQICETLEEKGSYEWDFSNWLQKNKKRIINTINKHNVSMLSDTFNESDGVFQHTEFNWSVEPEVLTENSKSRAFNVSISIKEGSPILEINKEKNSSIIKFNLSEKMPNLSHLISSIILTHIQDKGGSSNTMLFPSERSGLNLFYKELSSRRTALLHHASREDFNLSSLLKDVIGSKYASPIADYIDWLNNLTNIKKHKSDDFHQVANEIKKLVNGKYEINSRGEIYFTPRKIRTYKNENKKMNLHLGSSTVKSLFSFWFYLEHQAREGDILMIDEPELNLHPTNQRLIARVISLLVNRGIRVIVSTHSDYFLREISSLIMLSDPRSNKKQYVGKNKIYSEGELLDTSQVSAYTFENKSITKMEISSEEGIIATTFDNEINDLNKINDDIYYTIQSHKDENG